MINWFKKKSYPAYWNEYTNFFKTKELSKLDTTRFIIFDTETTGLNTITDRILSIGAIQIIENTIDISKSFEVYLEQTKFNKDTVEIHGILKGGSILKINEEEAIIQFLKYIEDAVLVAHHASFDITMINSCLKRMELPPLKNKVLDTGVLFKKTSSNTTTDKHYSLDNLCSIYKIAKHDRHTASGDAYITGIIFLKIISNLKKSNQKLTFKDLFYIKSRGLL